MLRLINDILDMSKIEAGQVNLNVNDLNLHDLLDDLEILYRSRAESKQLTFNVQRDKNLIRFVSSDDGKLRQILVNLIGNAIKFTDSGGIALRVKTTAITGKDNMSSLRLIVEVEDTGCGIAKEELDNIFSSFHQSTGGIKAGGTGLGLSISRKFIELMGGDLKVRSELGKGSCFSFEVPIEHSDEFIEKEKQTTPRIFGLEPLKEAKRILIVDDREDNRTYLRSLLGLVGFELNEASNGQEALEIFETWKPHAVLMDMRMPIMDGYEATKRLKESESGRTTPVIAVTASAFDENKKEIFASGADDYLRKPFKPEELFEVLGRCLGLGYVYAEDKGNDPERSNYRSITQESIEALPRELVEAMQNALAEGDMTHFVEKIDDVRNMDIITADALKALADQYDYETLNKWLFKKGNGNA